MKAAAQEPFDVPDGASASNPPGPGGHFLVHAVYMLETGNMARPTDEELMARYQQGEIAAFDLLYLRYEQRVYPFLRRLVGDGERAAELFQDTFMQLHKSRGQYDPQRPFAAWIFRIARNLAYNEIRRARRQERLLEGAGYREEGAGQSPLDPDSALEAKQLQEQVERALQLLPEEQREAILLSHYGGLKYKEIAEMAGISADAVKQRVRRGMKALREHCRVFLQGG